MSQLRHELLPSSQQYAAQHGNVILWLYAACLIVVEISRKEYRLLPLTPPQ
jgi:hypothetical protein